MGDMDKLYLYYPQWQGSGHTNEIYYGAKLLRDGLDANCKFAEIEIEETEDLLEENQILGYNSICRHLEKCKKILEENDPSYIFTIGGDCGVEVLPVSWLNNKYSSDLIVIWLDAHGDLNTPESSPSKTFHGMPLRSLLGDGDSNILRYAGISLNPSQVILCGVRDLDEPETQYIADKAIVRLPSDKVISASLLSAAKNYGCENLYIHLDLDVIDSKVLPDVKCPSPGGISWDTLFDSIQILKNSFTLVGASIVEYTSKSAQLPPELLRLESLLLKP